MPKNSTKTAIIEQLLKLHAVASPNVPVDIVGDRMVEAHRWAIKALKHARSKALSGDLPAQASIWTEGRISVGTAFSGIGTPECAVKYLVAAGQMLVPRDCLPVFELCFALDKETLCRKARLCRKI